MESERLRAGGVLVCALRLGTRAGPENLNSLRAPGAASVLLNSGSWQALLISKMASWLLNPNRVL